MKKKNIISIGLIAVLFLKQQKNFLHLFIHDLTVLMLGQTVI